jgi:hypothetical protein
MIQRFPVIPTIVMGWCQCIFQTSDMSNSHEPGLVFMLQLISFMMSVSTPESEYVLGSINQCIELSCSKVVLGWGLPRMEKA